jgi:hypothetical protein
MDERRRHRRIQLKLPTTLHLGPDQPPYRAYVMDLAEAGAFVMMDAVAPVGQRVRMQFRVGTDDVCQAIGTVARVMPFAAGQGLALDFDTLNDTWTHFVRNLGASDAPAQMSAVADIADVTVWLD